MMKRMETTASRLPGSKDGWTGRTVCAGVAVKAPAVALLLAQRGEATMGQVPRHGKARATRRLRASQGGWASAVVLARRSAVRMRLRLSMRR